MVEGVIRIGEGAGYSGAWLEPAVDLAARGALDYLLFECLADAGAANPGAAGQAVADVARRLGLAGLRVGVVTGDDVLGRLEPGLALAETGQTLGQLGDRVVSANAYLGAEPLVEA